MMIGESLDVFAKRVLVRSLSSVYANNWAKICWESV